MQMYCEKQALEYKLAQDIIKRTGVRPVLIDSYRDIFNRPMQSVKLQKKHQSIILAVKKDNFLQKGSDKCQSFGIKSYYYTVPAMNCPYDCSYCFLKGMYSSSYIVIFVNIDDYFESIRNCSKNEDNVYISLSHESDLLSLEPLTRNIRSWAVLANELPNIQFEVRTKCASTFVMNTLANGSNATNSFPRNFILAFSLLPDLIIREFEPSTPPLDMRLKAINHALTKGIPLRLCFDPLIWIKNSQEIYNTFIDEVFTEIDPGRIRDVSIGNFRIPDEFSPRFERNTASKYLSLLSSLRNDDRLIVLNKQLANSFFAKLSCYFKESDIYTI